MCSALFTAVNADLIMSASIRKFISASCVFGPERIYTATIKPNCASQLFVYLAARRELTAYIFLPVGACA